MKYDDASWHYGGKFPSDLSAEAAGTHTGMFVAWCMLNKLAGDLFIEDFPDDIDKLKSGEYTPGQWFLAHCDGKFTDEDLNDLGNEFTTAYFDFENGEYLSDYENAVGRGFETLYHVPDTWDTYNKIEPIISNKFNQWLTSKS